MNYESINLYEESRLVEGEGLKEELGTLCKDTPSEYNLINLEMNARNGLETT
jgi:hypothetical protein